MIGSRRKMHQKMTMLRRKRKSAKMMPQGRHLRKMRLCSLGSGIAAVPSKVTSHSGRSGGGASHFIRKFIHPLKRVMESIWSEQPSKSPAEILTWLNMTKMAPIGHVTVGDAKRLIGIVRRVLGKLDAVGDTPQVKALRASATKLQSQLHLCGRMLREIVTCSASGNRQACSPDSVAEVLRNLCDALVIVVPTAKGSGLSVRIASAYGGGPPEDPTHRRGKGLGGLIIRTGIVNCPYTVLPDHETIKFCPVRGKRSKTYLIRRTQVEAWKIVNRLSAKMRSGKTDWYDKFTGRDANVLRSANAEFLKDCIERERCPEGERKGNQQWTGYARLRQTTPPWWK